MNYDFHNVPMKIAEELISSSVVFRQSGFSRFDTGKAWPFTL